mmetsp:Transcript_56681/g.169336  ORF Transcript_56681/g.169336 Transcript_56681/m.169336 type:complete len:103 (-) Transcript_56681:25-333(-)
MGTKKGAIVSVCLRGRRLHFSHHDQSKAVKNFALTTERTFGGGESEINCNGSSFCDKLLTRQDLTDSPVWPIVVNRSTMIGLDGHSVEKPFDLRTLLNSIAL